MTDAEMKEMTSDFNLFMEHQGFMRIDDLARKMRLCPVTIRGWIHNGLVPDSDMVIAGNVTYIRSDIKKPTKDRGKRFGKYSGAYICGKKFGRYGDKIWEL